MKIKLVILSISLFSSISFAGELKFIDSGMTMLDRGVENNGRVEILFEGEAAKKIWNEMGVPAVIRVKEESGHGKIVICEKSLHFDDVYGCTVVLRFSKK